MLASETPKRPMSLRFPAVSLEILSRLLSGDVSAKNELRTRDSKKENCLAYRMYQV